VGSSDQTSHTEQPEEETSGTASEAEDKVADSLEGMKIVETPEQNSNRAEETGNDAQRT
jgi:hypothetical protein